MIDMVDLDKLEGKAAKIYPLERLAQVNLFLLVAAFVYVVISAVLLPAQRSIEVLVGDLAFLIFALAFTFAVAVFAARVSRVGMALFATYFFVAGCLGIWQWREWIDESIEHWAFIVRICLAFILQVGVWLTLLIGAIQVICLSATERRFFVSTGGVTISQRLWAYTGLPPTFAFLQAGRPAVFLLFAASSVSYANITRVVYQDGKNFGRTLLSVYAACAGMPNEQSCIDQYAVSQLAFDLGSIVLEVAGSVALGTLLLNMARARMRVSMEVLQLTDRRQPVLFLRPFRDDRVGLQPPKLPFLGRLLEIGRRESNLDYLLLEEGSSYGPVVAVGNPRDESPPYGIARGYFANDAWETAVSELCNASQAIVIVIDDSEGVRWEIEHIIRRGHFSKAIFILHPRFIDRHLRIDMYDYLLRTGVITTDVHREWRSLDAGQFVLCFSVDGTQGVVTFVSSTFSRLACSLAVRHFFLCRKGAIATQLA